MNKHEMIVARKHLADAITTAEDTLLGVSVVAELLCESSIRDDCGQPELLNGFQRESLFKLLKHAAQDAGMKLIEARERIESGGGNE